MPAQPCFKLASALLVTYGEEGILAVQESLRKSRPLADVAQRRTWRSARTWRSVEALREGAVMARRLEKSSGPSRVDAIPAEATCAGGTNVELPLRNLPPQAPFQARLHHPAPALHVRLRPPGDGVC